MVRLVRCTARQGARVRCESDLCSEFVADVARGDVVEVVESALVSTAEGKVERVRLRTPKGWASRKCFEEARAAPDVARVMPAGVAVHVVVVGAGPLGLCCAALCKARGFGVTVLEKQDRVGGDWRRWGNRWSKLQTHKSGYLLGAPRDSDWSALASYPSRGAMLRYFEAFARLNGLEPEIVFGATVTGRTALLGDGLLRVRYVDRGGVERRIAATHVFAAPGRVNVRRECAWPGEGDFRGVLKWGSGGDLTSTDLAGQRVLVVGHGSFALENMRHALESRAASVTLLARSDQLVLSRAVSYAIDRNADRAIPRDFVAHHLEAAYALLGRDRAWLDALIDASASKRTTTPTSDLYFLARRLGKVTVRLGDLVAFDDRGVVLRDGARLDADVVLKCTGFTRDVDFDASMYFPEGTPPARRTEVVDRWANWFVDPERRVFLSSSTSSESFVPKKGNSWSANVFTPSAPAESFFAAAFGMGDDAAAERRRLYDKPTAEERAGMRHADRTRQAGPNEAAFLSEQKTEWARYLDLLGGDLDYPYDALPRLP